MCSSDLFPSHDTKWIKLNFFNPSINTVYSYYSCFIFSIIMCLYPKLIPNKRYLPTKKNGGVPPVCPDERLRYVTAACGDCYECRKQKQRQWVVRMSEENRQTPNAYFLTLTIDDKSYKQLKQKYKLKDNNDLATNAIVTMLRKSTKINRKICKTLVYHRTRT